MIVLWLARPLRRLAAHAQRVASGTAAMRSLEGGANEIGMLSRSLARAGRAARDRERFRDALTRSAGQEVADHYLRHPAAPSRGSELREVTVLFSDLRGFTALSERIGPADLVARLNEYLGRMTAVILAHGGTITEFIGDGILVAFGAPVARDDDTARAIRCAWAMQRELERLNAEHRAPGLDALAMGIGIDAGVVAAGLIGGPDRTHYTVIGPAVNLASRLEGLARGGEIVLTETVRAKTARIVRVGPARRVRAKGFTEPVTVYRLVALADEPPTPDRDQAATSGRAGLGAPLGRTA